MLPQNIKDKVSKTFNKYKEWINSTTYDEKVKINFINILNNVERFMNSEDYSDHLQTFVDTTLKLDKIRNQDIKSLVPELKDLFNAHN